jgi:Asp-tRNA(Asn)/Glu-tRNA(Gln) amidotransferase A subunit family amidase
VDAFAGVAAAQAVIMAAEAAQVFREERQRNDARLSPTFRALLDEGERCTPDRLREARQVAERGRRELQEVFASVDALLTPAALGEAPVGLQSTGDPAFCRTWTLLGCPCVSLPVLKGPAGLPIGLQVVGDRGGDARLLEVAAWIEKRL